jgi:hypothetical protein
MEEHNHRIKIFLKKKKDKKNTNIVEKNCYSKKNKKKIKKEL